MNCRLILLASTLLLPLAACSSSSAKTDAAAIAAPRLVAPISVLHTTSRAPTFTWELAPGTTGAHVDLCADRACTQIVTSFDADGTSGAPAVALPPGKVAFWRAFGRASGTSGTTASPTWEVAVSASAATTPLATWGFIADGNGDGYADIAAGGMLAAVPVHLQLGGPMGAGDFSPLGGPALQDVAIAVVGDVDGDGFGDLIVSGSGTAAPNPIIVQLVKGSANGFVLGPTIPGLSNARAAGDVNGDGYADVLAQPLVTATMQPNPRVILGSASGLSMDAGIELPVSGATRGACDWNGDGLHDVFVLGTDGASGFPLHVFFGSKSGFGTEAPLAITIPESGAVNALDCIGDVNGDGYPELRAETRQAIPSNVPTATILYGGASPTGAARKTITLGTQLTANPDSVAPIGDVNGDGFDDALVMVDGVAKYYRGGAAGLTAGPMEKTFSDPQAIAIAGDVNGDGVGDFVVTSGGNTVLYLGSATLPPPTADQEVLMCNEPLANF